MGLAMGMGCTLFILLWVNDERSYDKIHDNYKSVYQVMANWNFNGQINTGNSVVFPLASALQDGYTQVEKATVTRINSRVVLSHGEKKLTRQGLTVSEDYFDIFSWKFIKGNAADALADPSSVILTSSTATALFGKGNPMNQFVTFDNGTTLDG